jgi:hypothetical protein
MLPKEQKLYNTGPNEPLIMKCNETTVEDMKKEKKNVRCLHIKGGLYNKHKT